jgi:L-asparaginase
MKFLSQKEKQALVFLTTAALASIVVSIYLGLNTHQKNKNVDSKKIYIIHTSGNIEKNFKENCNTKSVKYDINSYQPQMNSCDISPNYWNVIAKDIFQKYNNYCAFVIVCGSDTMAYTASALSFMLENLSKPVIITDRNLKLAAKLASKTKIPEVMIEVEGKLLRGCRTIHKSLEYFTSPNYPYLDSYNCLEHPSEKFQIKFVDPNINILVVKVFPGISDISLNFSDDDVSGIVLEIYESGNAPNSKNFINAIKKLIKKGVVIVAVSQCEKVLQFDIDKNLLQAGVIAGNDMTTPAAYAKLYFLLSNVKNKDLIYQLMEKTFRGEMTVNYPSV